MVCSDGNGASDKTGIGSNVGRGRLFCMPVGTGIPASRFLPATALMNESSNLNPSLSQKIFLLYTAGRSKVFM